MRHMRTSPGCLTCRLLVDPDDGTELTLVSEWDERRDVEAFVASRDFLIIKGMRMLLREDPQAVLDEIASRERLSFKR
jgi:quinol monooxygenase YgiN